MDLFHDVFIGLLSRAFFFGDVEFVTTHGEVSEAGLPGLIADPAEIEQKIKFLPIAA